MDGAPRSYVRAAQAAAMSYQNRKKLRKLAEVEGYESVLELIEANCIDSVVPAICMNAGCDYTAFLSRIRGKGGVRAANQFDEVVSYFGGSDLMDDTARRIRDLNDAFRRNPQRLGRLMLTVGILNEGPQFVDQCLQTVKAFDAFDRGKDPYHEHDFGAFEVDRKRVFFKIDYYDTNLRFGSPDPTDPTVTYRVMTIMLAEEYNSV
jgi:hypothetical protein